VTILVEICVDSPAGLAAAIAGGANRIELCAALSLGGLTPSPGLISAARDCPVPVRAMIRPRDGDFRFDQLDTTAMLADIETARAAGLSGIVIGAHNGEGLDIALLRELTAAASDMDITLHRVVDLLDDPVAAVDVALELGIATILTSGGAHVAIDGARVIRAMQDRAAGRIEVLAGAGVRASNVAALIAASGVTAVHASCATPVENTDARARTFGFVSGYERTTDRASVAALRSAADEASLLSPPLQQGPA
jgi:copper homeostasis protein